MANFLSYLFTSYLFCSVGSCTQFFTFLQLDIPSFLQFSSYFVFLFLFFVHFQQKVNRLVIVCLYFFSSLLLLLLVVVVVVVVLILLTLSFSLKCNFRHHLTFTTGLRVL